MFKHTLIALVLVFGALASFCFADIGPSPTPPGVTVYLVKDGAPFTNITTITYHCMGQNSTDEGSVTKVLTNLDCNNGTCIIKGWFYKFNPCFHFPSGFFSYDYEGKTMNSDSFNNTENAAKYEFTLDVSTGHLTKLNKSTPPNPQPTPQPSLCGSAAIILFVAFLGILVTRKN